MTSARVAPRVAWGLVVILALAGAALAGPAGSVRASGGASAAALAAPLTCTGTCVVTASTTQGYAPPLLVLGAGSILEWRSIEGGHASVGGGCLLGDFGYNALGQIADVRFDILGGLLAATVIDVDHGTPIACTGALALPDGSFSMGYTCPFHANMNGHIVVRP